MSMSMYILLLKNTMHSVYKKCHYLDSFFQKLKIFQTKSLFQFFLFREHKTTTYKLDVLTVRENIYCILIFSAKENEKQSK